MKLRQAYPEDLETMMIIINQARQSLAQANIPQWQEGYPNRQTLKQDLQQQQAYLWVQENRVLGLAVLQAGIEPTYVKLTAGQWQAATAPYITLHRVALADEARGQGQAVPFLKACIQQAHCLGVDQVRTDTHRLNLPMQHTLLTAGFIYRGRLQVASKLDPERWAYQYG